MCQPAGATVTSAGDVVTSVGVDVVSAEADAAFIGAAVGIFG